MRSAVSDWNRYVKDIQTKLVTVRIDGKSEVHLPGYISDYATLCGLDGNDSNTNQRIEPTTTHKVTCEHCKQIWEQARAFPRSVFIK